MNGTQVIRCGTNHQHKLCFDDTIFGGGGGEEGLLWIKKWQSIRCLLEHLESSGTESMIKGINFMLVMCGKIQRNKGILKI